MISKNDIQPELPKFLKEIGGLFRKAEDSEGRIWEPYRAIYPKCYICGRDVSIGWYCLDMGVYICDCHQCLEAKEMYDLQHNFH